MIPGPCPRRTGCFCRCVLSNSSHDQAAENRGSLVKTVPRVCARADVSGAPGMRDELLSGCLPSSACVCGLNSDWASMSAVHLGISLLLRAFALCPLTHPQNNADSLLKIWKLPSHVEEERHGGKMCIWTCHRQVFELQVFSSKER